LVVLIILNSSIDGAGFISHIGAVAENLLFWLDYFLSGCSEKSFRKKEFLSERVKPTTSGTKYRAQERRALVSAAIESLNKSSGLEFPYKGSIGILALKWFITP
jgi:hypothetical protein